LVYFSVLVFRTKKNLATLCPMTKPWFF
jgi:hypothetical protein